MTPAKWLLVGAPVLVVLMQFVGPEKTNPPVDPAKTIGASLHLPPEVGALLERACGNCHSHQTRWPWYSHVAPVSWFVIDHVNHGRREMNLSEWGQYDREKTMHLLEEMCELVEKREMPLPPYPWMHEEARLTEEDIQTICDWTKSERQRLKSSEAEPGP